jgi:hypothetical protein
MDDLELKEIERLRQVASLAHEELEGAVREWRGAIVKRAASVGVRATARDVGVSKESIYLWRSQHGGVYNHKNIPQKKKND